MIFFYSELSESVELLSEEKCLEILSHLKTGLFTVVAPWVSAGLRLTFDLTGISESVSSVMFDEQNIFDKDDSNQQSIYEFKIASDLFVLRILCLFEWFEYPVHTC